MMPFVASVIRRLAPLTVACLAFTSATGAASALEPSLASAPAVQTLQDVEHGRVPSLVAEGATHGNFVCMAEYDESLPACELDADGAWDCWGELGSLAWNVTVCAAGFGLPAFKALRAIDAAHDAFMAARTAKKARDARALTSVALAGSAVSAAWTALAALLGDFMCLYLKDSFDAWKDCLFA